MLPERVKAYVYTPDLICQYTLKCHHIECVLLANQDFLETSFVLFLNILQLDYGSKQHIGEVFKKQTFPIDYHVFPFLEGQNVIHGHMDKLLLSTATI